ncbi:MAG TPA: cell division protein FtsH, partial [Desulfuromonadaceae bacterium]
EIDEEIRRIVDDSYRRALTLLRDNIQTLHNLSACLIEKENLSGAEVDVILASQEPLCNPANNHGQQHTDIQA